MQDTVEMYALIEKGTNRLKEIGTKGNICWRWSELKYQHAPDEEFTVKKVKIEFLTELTKSEIDEEVEKMYMQKRR